MICEMINSGIQPLQNSGTLFKYSDQQVKGARKKQIVLLGKTQKMSGGTTTCLSAQPPRRPFFSIFPLNTVFWGFNPPPLLEVLSLKKTLFFVRVFP